MNVVVGGGIAGLTAARSLARAGAQVTVLEASPRWGGRLATYGSVEVRHGGETFTFPDEHGLHAMWARYANVRRQLDELGLSPHLVDPGTQEHLMPADGGRAILAVDVGDSIRGSRWPSPFAMLVPWAHPALARSLRDAGPVAAMRVLGALSTILAFDPDDPRDVAAYDARSIASLVEGWPRSHARLFESITHAAYFDELDRVSLAAFCTGLYFYFIGHQDDSRFSVLDGDAGSVWVDPLVCDLRRLGVTMRSGCRVDEVVLTDNRARAVVFDGAERLEADGVVLALDPPALARLTRGTALASERSSGRGLGSVVARLWYEDAPNPDRAASGMMAGLGADCFFWLHRLYRPFRAWSDRTGGGVLEVHLYGDRVAGDDDAKLAALAALVKRAWPEVRREPVHATIRRNPETQVALLRGTVASLPGVVTACANVMRCGDGISHPTPAMFLERACSTGLAAARALGSTLGLDRARLQSPLGVPPPDRAVRTLRDLARAGRWITRTERGVSWPWGAS